MPLSLNSQPVLSTLKDNSSRLALANEPVGLASSECGDREADAGLRWTLRRASNLPPESAVRSRAVVQALSVKRMTMSALALNPVPLTIAMVEGPLPSVLS